MKQDITQTKTAMQALTDLLNRADRTEREAREKLLKKGYAVQEVEAAIATAKEYRYISDEAYAERYVYFKRGTKGKYLILQQLVQKGIDVELANVALEAYDDSAAACQQLAFRYLKGKVWEPKTRDKLLHYLTYKGFSYDEAKGAADAAKQKIAQNGSADEADFEDETF